MFQDSVRWDFSGVYVGINVGGWVGNISQCIDIWVEVWCTGGGCCFYTFMCGGVLIGGGVSRFQVWVCGTVRSLIWTQLLQLGKKFLEVILLVSGGGYFWGDSNGIDLGVGCWNSGVVLGFLGLFFCHWCFYIDMWGGGQTGVLVGGGVVASPYLRLY